LKGLRASPSPNSWLNTGKSPGQNKHSSSSSSKAGSCLYQHAL
jgi:hypothetical protein